MLPVNEIKMILLANNDAPASGGWNDAPGMKMNLNGLK